VIVGSPGNDGSHAFGQLIQQSAEQRVAAIVPKRSIRRKRPTGDVSLIPTTERLIRLGEGCSCCTVRGDLLTKVQRIAEEQSADHLLIQASAHTDLRILAKTFTVADAQGAVLSDVARIDSLVTVLDAGAFYTTVGGTGARALIERVEFANVVLLEGTSSLSPDMLDRVRSGIAVLNPNARIVRGDEDKLQLSAVQADHPFDLDQAEQRAAGMGEASGSNTASGAVVRFDYQARRPFHPARLHALIEQPWAGILRVQGSFWVASRPNMACSMDIAGASRNTLPEGMWWASVPTEERPGNPDLARYLESIWHPEYGDRHNKLSIVGTETDAAELRDRLQTCLLNDEELAAPEQWGSMQDPFKWPDPMQ